MTDETSEVYVQYIYIYTRFSHFSVPKKSQIEQWTSKKGVKNITKPYIYTHNLDIFIKKNAARHTGKKNTKPYIYIHIYTRNLNFMAKI